MPVTSVAMFAPFQGLLFDPGRVGAPGAATSPPYDVISPQERDRLKAASPFNIVRLLLAEPADGRYQEAASLLSAWRRDGVLVHDDEPRFYLYDMEFDGHHARIGALAVEDFGERVLPHEETREGTKADRMAVLEATRANLDPIVALSPADELLPLLEPAAQPRIDFDAGGIRHRLYDVIDPETVASIQKAVAAHPVAIADGHHRYTTALRFRNAQDRPGPWDAIMAFLAPAEGSGLRIDPVHRAFPFVDMVPDLSDRFEAGETAPVPPGSPGSLVLAGGAAHGAAVQLLTPRPDALAELPEPWREASAAVGRELLYSRLGVDESDATYYPDAAEALAWLASHPAGVVVFNAPVSEHAIATASEAGLRFPSKTTFFQPKPRAGLVLRSFDE